MASTLYRQKVVSSVLAADIANNGTLTISYPAGTNQAFFTGGNASATGEALINDDDRYTEAGSTISLTYGASNITLTNLSGKTWPAGSSLRVGLAYAPVLEHGSPQVSAALTSLTDNTTGTASDTLAALADLSTSNTYTDAALNAKLAVIRNALASNAAKINALIAAARGAGQISS